MNGANCEVCLWGWQCGGEAWPAVGTAEGIAASRPMADWQRRSAGAGTKGPASMAVRRTMCGPGGLLIRRHIAGGALAFFLTWCPAGTPLAKLVAVEGHRWSIEDSFETTKNELGLDHNET